MFKVLCPDRSHTQARYHLKFAQKKITPFYYKITKLLGLDMLSEIVTNWR